MKITPQDIHSQDFKRSIRGYDMDEVDAFLTQIADQLEQVVSENQRLKDKVKEVDGSLGEQRNRNELLEETLRAAQKITEQIKESSRKESESTADAARRDAETIIAKANEEAAGVQTQIIALKRQRDSFIMQFKAVLDTHYKFLYDIHKGQLGAKGDIPPQTHSSDDKTATTQPGKPAVPPTITSKPDEQQQLSPIEEGATSPPPPSQETIKRPEDIGDSEGGYSGGND